MEAEGLKGWGERPERNLGGGGGGGGVVVREGWPSGRTEAGQLEQRPASGRLCSLSWGWRRLGAGGAPLTPATAPPPQIPVEEMGEPVRGRPGLSAQRQHRPCELAAGSRGRAASCCLSSCPPAMLFPPNPPRPTPGRPALAGQHGAQQSVLRGDCRHRWVSRTSSLGVWGSGCKTFPNSP